MAIDPTLTLNIRPDGAHAQPQRSPDQQPRSAAFNASSPRAPEAFIPSNASIATLVNSAVAAKRQGSVWDRGSILNIEA